MKIIAFAFAFTWPEDSLKEIKTRLNLLIRATYGSAGLREQNSHIFLGLPKIENEIHIKPEMSTLRLILNDFLFEKF